VQVRYPAVAVMAPVVALALAACGSSGASSTGNTTGKQKVGGATANVHGTKDVTGMSSVTIAADNFYFDPSILKGTPGQRLTITINNTTGTEHNFTVKSQHVDSDIEDGKSATVTVTLPSSGTISFYCEYHKALAMAGGLESG